MVESAKISTGFNSFQCCGADEIDTKIQYDLVMAESVFQYFETLEYAEIVLRKMIEKSKRIVYLGEIHDKRFEYELLELRKKKIHDYETRYRGLDKLFIDREWIVNIAKEYGKNTIFTQTNNPLYLNGKYVYNVFIF